MRRSAFTLIELLVVIAIIAILAAILFPVFSQAREKARQAACISNNRNIALSYQQYTQDYDERVMPYECWGCGGSQPGSGSRDPWRRWFVRTEPYVKNKQLYACPSGSTCERMNQWGGGCAWGWAIPPSWYGATMSYGYNLVLAGWYDGNVGQEFARSLAQVNRPADVFAIADSSHKDACAARIVWANRCQSAGFCPPDGQDWWANNQIREDWVRKHTRHLGGSVLIYADGHVKWSAWNQLWRDYNPDAGCKSNNLSRLHGWDQF